MAYVHVSLTESQLGPAVWKVVQPGAPAPLQGMVARGLAPLPPRDLVVALYQLWVTNVPELAEQAARTAEGLPIAVLRGALGEPSLPAGAIDFIARKLPRNVEVLGVLVGHPATHDETLVGLARICPESICDMLATNEDRWLRCPAIVESLYQNPNCRMSVAQRMIELAVREGIDLRLPNIEEIKQAIASKAGHAEDEDEAAADEQFRAIAQRVIAGQEEAVRQVVEAPPDKAPELELPDDDEETLAELDAALGDGGTEGDGDGEPDESDTPAPLPEIAGPKGDRVSQISKLNLMQKIRLAMLGNAFERRVLIRDSNRSVCMSAIKSPRMKENEVVTYCANRSLSHDVVRYIASRRDWTKLYAVKLNLVLNPKTPMAAAMTFLTHLHMHDVRKVGHSKNIPSSLAVAAKRRLMKQR